MKELEGVAAFITGGGGGIGLGIAQCLARRGVRLAIADVSAGKLVSARALAEEEGWAANAIFLPLDISDRGAFAAALARAEESCGPLRILINNAGVAVNGPVAEAGFPDWDWALAVNLGGVVNGIVCGLPLLRRHGLGGHIVNTASLGALMPPRPTRGIYATTKSAIIALSEHLRLDLEGSGIGVSVLLPGPTRTNIEDSWQLRPAELREGSRFDGLAKAGTTQPPADLPWRDPTEIGEMTLAGILENRPYIVTHPEYAGAVKARNRTIEDAIADWGDAGNG
ncbi:NAD(P)-dependent dehydrogenase (short-subunit alcohol dehydrogenase family) [Altererythrobacter atlanticus]|uniref:2-(R)-hydroxypropyl-CoM dehydrogenase n=1 Tax=Croceibacterium atlanticum TaxID=1267766 RepID=A0A0F7KVU9_9SPHN|nr:SDR family NAD(P)-dependent oxidoreductase [Croceibacterium atlanticum]AKH42880.1 2-(R)-hydroxypropyl-CoM dehydrogenase [Croceibacterium atlanticum]MBB5731660.1 NAD(P)-dependent dehydrogenase (short-subunit alcohol dehydrogenase family) [Croceibacterium atlanticum]